jgi:two-component system NtrC family sensor kinase
VLGLPPGHEVVRKLRRLDSEIGSLRRTGEDIISVSKDLDRAAREKAENGLRVSQVAILLVFPLFLLIGLGVLFIIGTDVAHRLRTLIRLVEKAGERYVSDEGAPPEIKAGHDEVEVLIRKFRNMEAQLVRWEEELDRKNLELLQSKKLSAIGTLASGVAHELNNPLNNIYVSAQVLKKEMGEECPPFVKGIVEDIAGQTARVKNIVADLLEFARGGEPRLGKVELGGLIRGAYDLAGKSMDTSGVRFDLDADPGGVYLLADREQLERVFINLFTNAVDAMGGAGRLAVAVAEEDGSVKIGVSDTGRGMGAEEREKVFDPFFTTKDKGTGLGLAIVFNSISKHGGEISVQSEPGRGTVFNIKLPKGDVNGL